MTEYAFEKPSIKLGVYKHFKDFVAQNDKAYSVLGIAADTEQEGKWLVIYQAHYGEKKLWARPADMFLQEVDKPELGYKGPRFIFVREA
jgi:hypothetical protein